MSARERPEGRWPMLKWISPIVTRFKLLPRPRMFAVPSHTSTKAGEPTFGQLLAERVAAFVGSWAFLSAQAGFLLLWLIYNTLQITHHFDPPPYILLNLLLSFQAAFTGPVLLIAANVGAIRDHAQSDRIEHLTNESEQLSAQNRDLVQRLLNIEQLLDEHINSSLQAHTAELHELGTVIRAIHAAVCVTPAEASPDGEVVPAVAADSPASTVDAPSREPVPARASSRKRQARAGQ
jgi:uncharacterized membrane protein